jgi:ferredoxin
MEKWVEINKIYADKWPVITEKKPPPTDSKDWENVENKFNDHFNDKPGKK